jgi:hypothetical protein
MDAFAKTMNDSKVFLTYSLSMTMLAKATKLLAERGADRKAISFINTGMELLAKQLDEFASHKELEEELEEKLNLLCRENQIDRAPQNNQEA